MDEQKLACGLGWFSIGLGLAEVFATKRLTTILGLEQRAGLVRLFGLREIATGVGILTQRQKGPWVWGRVAGDALDLALLGSALGSNNAHRTSAAIATANVAAVTALDVVCGTMLSARG